MKVATIAIHLLGWFIAGIWILPFLGIFITSIRPYDEVLMGWWKLETLTLTLDNYVKAFFHPSAPVSRAMINSLIVATPSTLIPIFVGLLASYSFARLKHPISDFLFFFIVVSMAIPAQMVLIPLFLTLHRLGLLDTLGGIILVHSGFGLPWIILFLRNFFLTLPVEIEEQAMIDGASYPIILFKIILPLALPALISVGVLQFSWVWNDFLFALAFLYSPENFVVTQTLPLIRGRFIIDWSVVSAASIMAMSVPMILYFTLQKYYIRGVLAYVRR